MSVEDFIRDALKHPEFQRLDGRQRLKDAVVKRFHISRLEATMKINQMPRQMELAEEEAKVTLRLIRKPWPRYEKKGSRSRPRK